MKPIPAYEGRYSAAEDGRIYSHLSGKFLKPARAGDKREYLSVQLGRGNREYVHALVLRAFKGECPAGMQARHLDGDSENNANGNLEWSTPRVNTLDKNAHGTMLRGDRHPNTVLSTVDVARLIARRAQGISYPQLGREFGISKSQAHRICAGTSRKARMSWLYVPELPCSPKECEPHSSFLDSSTAPFATLSGRPLLPPNLRRSWRRDAWIKRLSGLTYSPLTAQLGAERWIASLPDSHAKTSLSPDAAPDSTESAPASFSRFFASRTIAVRGSSFWRTSQESLVPQLPVWTKKAPPSMSGITTRRAFRKWVLKMDAYSKERPPASWENWPTAGGTRNGSLFRRPTWVPAMGASDGSVSHGAWVTPHGMGGMDHSGKPGAGGEFAKQAANWATPNARDGRRPGVDLKSTQGANLNRDAALWPTPRSTDGPKGGPNQAGSKGDLMLPSAAAQWPTPGAGDEKGPSIGWEAAAARHAKNGQHKQMGLRDSAPRVMENWPTPAARDFRAGGQAVTRPDGKSRMDMLDWRAEAFSRQDQPTPVGQESLPPPHGWLLLLPVHLKNPKSAASTLDLSNGSWAGQSVGRRS